MLRYTIQALIRCVRRRSLPGRSLGLKLRMRRAPLPQERAGELQAFVEALLACSEEPRDVSELRRSEAAAAARAQRLQSRLDGPERAAELAAAAQQQARVLSSFVPCLCIRTLPRLAHVFSSSHHKTVQLSEHRCPSQE